MPASYSQKEEDRLQALLKPYLKDEQQSLNTQEQILLLQKKDRAKWWHLGINIAAILFFGYSFFYGITQLSDMLLYILFGVFVINVALIFYQKKQLRELIEYLSWQKEQE